MNYVPLLAFLAVLFSQAPRRRRHERGRASILNEHQIRRLLVSCEHIDRLLSDVEQILTASASKSPFPRWSDDSSPVQRKVTQDYIARLRAQLVRVLEGQGISRPSPNINSIHAIRVTLNFVDIAAEELKPKYMRGYGEIAEAKLPELNGIANEIQDIVKKLDLYLAQDLGQDLQGRLERLERTGNEIALLQIIERVIMDHGLVEFRSALSIILDRLEDQRFEIAFFGRVSAGKSSLLNHVIGTEMLPVGVTPITAIPTRISHGPEPKAVIQFADKQSSAFDISRLAEFATEQQNPGNVKHVTRINVEIPSERLRNGITFVDTPGLGSLASSGAAETLAYLPRCDLGVVLIDAGSTLTQEDLSTIRALYEASTPAQILLSKADLLKPQDRSQALSYIDSHIRSQLGLELSAYPVSIVGNDATLLDQWFDEHIATLYDRHQLLATESLKRKIGALREAVAATLSLKLDRATRASDVSEDGLRSVETELRVAGGRIEETRALCRNLLDEVPNAVEKGFVRAAEEIIKRWPLDDSELPGLVTSAFDQMTAEHSQRIYQPLEELRTYLTKVLDEAGRALNGNNRSPEEKLDYALKEMPRLDLGAIHLHLQPKFLMALGKRAAKRRVEKSLRDQTEPSLSNAIVSYGKLLQSWTTQALENLQRRFGERADWYRAQIGRLAGPAQISEEDATKIRRDLEQLARPTNLSLSSPLKEAVSEESDKLKFVGQESW
jgi:GTP-binding protein EngB required for normal cell division